MAPKTHRRRAKACKAADAVRVTATRDYAAEFANGIAPSRKRRPADSAATADAALAPTTTATADTPMKSALEQRGASSMNKSTIARLRADSRFKRVDEDEAEELRRAFESKLVVVDDETGEKRECDVSNADDRAYLAEKKHMQIMARKEGTANEPPESMATGMIGMSKDDLPDDMNNTDMFPFSALQLQMYMRDNANTLTDILMTLPLIPIPVMTPRLLNFIMLDTPTFPTQDSYNLLKIYISVLQLIFHGETVRRRTKTALGWLAGRLEDKTLQRDDVLAVANHMRFRCEIDDPAAADLLRNSFVQKFDMSEFSEAAIWEYSTYLSTVIPYDGAAWAALDRGVFADEVMDQHNAAGQNLCMAVGQQLDMAKDHKAVLEIVQDATARTLRLYEASILRLLSHAAFVDTIPECYFGDMCSKLDAAIVKDDDVHMDVREKVLESRKHITKVRSEAFTGDVRDVSHLVGTPCIPSTEEFNAYMAFINYNAEEPEDLAAAMARMQAVAHVVEPKEIIEGVSIEDKDVIEGVADAFDDEIMG